MITTTLKHSKVIWLSFRRCVGSQVLNDKLLETMSAQQSSVSSIQQKKAAEFFYMYNLSNPENKAEALLIMARDHGVQQQKVLELVNTLPYAENRGPAVLLKMEERLQEALKPRFQQLFTAISHQPEGVKFLVDLRADILKILQSKKSPDNDMAYLRRMSDNLKELLSLWFSVGFLRLENITWKSSCHIVQKISEYEAVHPIRSWADVKRRIGPNRRCFVFTHGSMPGEPLVVLHVALMPAIGDNIQKIVKTSDDFKPESEDPIDITAAVFYSITSTQRGLLGVDLGNYLIKTAVEDLKSEFPDLQQFSSLSPIPGFREWVMSEINLEMNKSSDAGSPSTTGLLTNEETTALSAVMKCSSSQVLSLLKTNLSSVDWAKQDRLRDTLRKPLMRLCARYLYLEKHRGQALNPVANFHLRNGAELWRLNWLADTSVRGLTASCGLMVNYRYYLDKTEENSTNYIQNRTIAVSDNVLPLLGEN